MDQDVVMYKTVMGAIDQLNAMFAVFGQVFVNKMRKFLKIKETKTKREPYIAVFCHFIINYDIDFQTFWDSDSKEKKKRNNFQRDMHNTGHDSRHHTVPLF